jgi:hypothetical protein
VASTPERRAKDGIDESGGARFSGRPNQINRIVNDGGRGHPREVQDLIEAQTKNGDDFLIETGDWSPREVADEVVEFRSPAKRSSNDVGGEGAVTVIREMLPALRERRGKVDATGLDGEQSRQGGSAGWSDHDDCWGPGG